jgi:plasmid stabilization system protein ParE
VIRRLRVAPEAEAEAGAAALWYETKRAGLGADFVATIDAALEGILAAPEAFPRWHPDRPFRRCVVARFPFVIFFIVSEQTVEVLAVAHAKRRPGYWIDR